VNILDSFINKEVGKRMTHNGGLKVLKSDIIAEIADFCGVSWEHVNRIKRGLTDPSLPLALKIAEYFNVHVEDIFKIS
jgi:transcriptional regulator with XRE-family HTH domain